MAKIVGMNGGNQPPQQPKIDLSQATEMRCQECGGTVFIPGTKFLKLSRIATGQPKDAIIPVELYLCGDCGEINQELLPNELQNNG
jgi:DNA-directed RNA polymerase subunit RPC12/RpoP